MLLKGEKGKTSKKQRLTSGGKWDFWKPWVPSKTPVPPLLGQFTEPCEGCPHSNIVPVNWYVHLIISVPIYALSYNRYNYVYVLAEYSIKKGDFCCTFNIILRLKRMCFLQGKSIQKEKQMRI